MIRGALGIRETAARIKQEEEGKAQGSPDEPRASIGCREDGETSSPLQEERIREPNAETQRRRGCREERRNLLLSNLAKY